MRTNENIPDERATRRVSSILTDSQVENVDQWGFARSIRDRSTAIRELIKAGLEASKNAEKAS